MSDRVIRIIGTIDEDAFNLFDEMLAELENEAKEPIKVILMSSGGDAYSALAFYDRIRLSPCVIHVRGYGCIMSAAVLILAAGDYRCMAENAWVMVHEDVGKIKHGSVVEAEREVKQLRALEDQWNKLLESRTGTTALKWSELHKATTYLNSTQCLELDLVDEVIFEKV